MLLARSGKGKIGQLQTPTSPRLSHIARAGRAAVVEEAGIMRAARETLHRRWEVKRIAEREIGSTLGLLE